MEEKIKEAREEVESVLQIAKSELMPEEINKNVLINALEFILEVLEER